MQSPVYVEHLTLVKIKQGSSNRMVPISRTYCVNKKLQIVYLLFALVITGCAARETRTLGGNQTPQTGKISKEELREELDKFEDVFISAMKQTAEAMDAASQTQRMQRINVQMQMRIVEALHAMSNPDDAVVAFLDTWGLIVRLRLYVEEGEGRALYGPHQPLAVSFMKTAESEMERIGNLFLTPQQFDESKKGIYTFAGQNPIGGTYANLVVYATKVKQEEIGVFLKTLSIPMAPIRAMEGVDKTADAIGKFRTSADRFTNVVEQLPESSRWQMSIMMDDFEESKMTQQFLKSLDEFSQSSARLVEVLNAMPKQMRTELTTVLNESGQAQTNLQATSKTAAEAAVAIKNASDSIQKLVSMFQSDTPRDVNAPPPFGMRDFDTMLLNAGKTADKIAGAAAQLQQASGSESKIELQKQLCSLVDHIAWRLFQLLLAVFVLLLSYRYIVKKVSKSA
jgi:hypothetical protein